MKKRAGRKHGRYRMHSPQGSFLRPPRREGVPNGQEPMPDPGVSPVPKEEFIVAPTANWSSGDADSSAVQGQMLPPMECPDDKGLWRIMESG